MKKILLFSILIFSFSLFAQSLSYVDQAILFSSDDGYGTARFSAMSGAFGALGGDMTAADINPAGLAVFNNSGFSTTLGYRDTSIRSTFYGSSVNNSDDYFRLTQAGGVIVFPTYSNSDFKKVTLGFNYNLIKDFNQNYAVRGNSGIAYYVDDPNLNFDDDDTNDIFYTNVDNQFFRNYTSGYNDRFSMTIGTQYKDNLYLGASVAFQNINFYQNAYTEELNNDGNGNLLDAFNNQYLATNGNGFNFGLGAIYKANQNLRLGISYQSPIWYDLTERFTITDPDSIFPDTPYPWVDGELDVIVSNDNQAYINETIPNYFDYSLNTPGKLTGSLSYIFGQKGLISFDYTYRDYNNLKLKPSSFFINENEDLSRNLSNTSSFKIGTEWRLNIISLRGGYRYLETPNSSDNITGYSLGFGVKFSSRLRFDFAFDNTSYTDQYKFIGIDEVEPAQLEIDTKRFTSSLVFNF